MFFQTKNNVRKSKKLIDFERKWVYNDNNIKKSTYEPRNRLEKVFI